MKSLADIYSTLKLERNQTRLLVVEPGRWSEAIICSLEILSLDSSYDYEALSYVWGDPVDTIPIHVNGCHLDAARNLFCALRRLRRSSGPRKVWVDAISINQDDLDERGAQVNMMREIYSKASVLVYLGESLATEAITLEEQKKWQAAPQDVWHKDDTKVVNLIQGGWARIDPPDGITDQSRVHEFFQHQVDARKTSTTATKDITSPVEALQRADFDAFAIINRLAHGRCLKDCLHSDTDNPAWIAALQALGHLARRPWWTRVWTLQEAVVAARRTAFYGNVVAPLDLIVEAGACIDWHYSDFRCCQDFIEKLPIAQRDLLVEFLKPTLAMSNSHAKFHAGWGLDDQLTVLQFYLDASRPRQATDARDKIYALLGLVKYRHDPVDIYPNYRKSASKVYTELAILMIQRRQNLDILLTNEHKQPRSDLPTWVPHWGPLQNNQHQNTEVHQRASYFRAGGSLSNSAQLCGDTALEVQAVEVGTISDIGYPLMQGPDDRGHILKQFLTFTGADRNPGAPYIGGGTLYDAFWRTALGDLLWRRAAEGHSCRRPEPSDAAAFSFLLQDYDTKAYMASQDPITMALYSEEQQQSVAQHFVSVQESFWMANSNKMYFRTKNGYIGSGPPDTEIGDRVFVLVGCKMPLILRPAATPDVEGIPKHHTYGYCYNLVGYAYVHGIMDGEMVAEYLSRASMAGLNKAGEAGGSTSTKAPTSARRSILSSLAALFGRSTGRGLHRIFLI